MATDLAYERVLLKISGEGFCEEGGFGIEQDVLHSIAEEIVSVVRLGVKLAIVPGGGNFIRGATFSKEGVIPRASADYMGMLATVLNAIALQEAMESLGQPTRVMSAIGVYSVCEPFIRRRMLRHLDKGRVVILAAGTGNPYFTTDTCASLRATEMQADVMLKATKVDGVFDKDPKKFDDAVKIDEIKYSRVINEQLRVMDMTAATMCQENGIRTVVFDLKRHGNIERVVKGERVGTVITA